MKNFSLTAKVTLGVGEQVRDDLINILKDMHCEIFDLNVNEEDFGRKTKVMING